MAFDNTNRGVLFREKNKKSETHPDLKGKINVGGKDYYLSAWSKTAKNGNKFLSLSLGKPVNDGRDEHEPVRPVQQNTNNNIVGDDLPF